MRIAKGTQNHECSLYFALRFNKQASQPASNPIRHNTININMVEDGKVDRFVLINDDEVAAAAAKEGATFSSITKKLPPVDTTHTLISIFLLFRLIELNKTYH